MIQVKKEETDMISYEPLWNTLKEKGITQVELAEFLNTTQSIISAYENGKTTLLTAFALQIVKKYNLSLDWLCGRK